MKEDSFPSRDEFRKRQNEIKNRHERLIQVREHSRKMAAAVVARMKEEAEKQYLETGNRILSEIREYYSRELSAVRQQYDKCVSEINQQHYIKQIRANEKNKPITFRKRPIILKKMAPEPNSKEVKSKKTDPKKEVESKRETEPIKGKNGAKMSSIINPSSSSGNSKKCNTLNNVNKDDSKIRSENIVIESEAEDAVVINNDHRRVNVSPNLRHGILRKSVVYHNKENYRVPKNFISHCSTKSTATFTNDVLNSDRVPHAILDQEHSEELYNRLVHDRIRVLEQKEKILSRRLPSPLTVSNVFFLKKPARFTEYFSDFRSQSSLENPPSRNMTRSHHSKSDNSELKSGMNDIEKDLTRVQLKKKLLALELSNAETQTEKLDSINASEFNGRTHSPTSSPTPNGNEGRTSSTTSHSASDDTNAKSSAKVLCPSPIPKETESSRENPRNKIEIRSKKNCKCRRRQLRKNDDVIVTVSNNKTNVITNNSANSNSSDLALSHFGPQSSAENETAPAVIADSHKTVKVIVNVLSNNEYKRSRNKPPEKQKIVSNATPNRNFKKTSNWKNIFENDEKLTESSYFSPPEATTKNVKFRSKPAIEFENSEKLKTEEKENQSHDIGYYIRKLLTMSPESVENLSVSTSDSTMVSEYDDQPKLEHKKLTLNVPLYQNSLDDTLETFFEPLIKEKQNESVQDNKVSSSGVEDSVDISFSEYLKKNVSSLAGSSSSQTESIAPSNTSRGSLTGKEHQHVVLIEDSTKVSDHADLKNLTKLAEKGNVENDFEEPFTLPTLEELKKRGFDLNIMPNKESIDDSYVDIEDIIKELLTVRFPSNEERMANPSSARSFENDGQENTNIKIDQEKDAISCKNEIDSVIQAPKGTNVSESQKQPSLLAWMGTTLKRTLEASAITSTSSGDNSDTIRRTLTTFERPFEGISELVLQSESPNSNRKSSLSPLKVPHLRLSIPAYFKNSL